jgi:hypothetical protein
MLIQAAQIAWKTMQETLLRATLLSFILLAATSPVNAQAQPQAYGLGHPFDLEDLPFGTLRERLESLPSPTRSRAMAWLHRFTFHEADFDFLRIDDTGGVFYADTFTPEATETIDSSGSGTTEAAPTAGETFSLHSRPGATNVLYLDFDGHLIPSSSAWTGIDLDAVPYDTDSNRNSFSPDELTNIAEIWRRIAEDFKPFDVDVTTEEPAYFGPTVARVLVTADTDANGNAMPAQGAGGVAYVGVWGLSSYYSKYSPALVYFNNLGGGRADYVAEAASHEAGHNLYLSHDATSSKSYYGGHGSGDISWGPLMGTGYNRNISQWSKGEYTDASNTEDDTGILAGHLAIRADDHADTLTGATRLINDAAGNISTTTPQDDPDNLVSDNKGVIETEYDLDVYYFDTDGGPVSLAVTPAWQDRYTRGGNLDIHAALYDTSGTLLVESDSQTATDASLSVSLVAGRYYLAVQGTGSSESPYSAYGSLGQYFITGTLPAVNDGSAPVPNPMSWATAPQAEGRDRIGMTATTASDDSGIVEYQFECISGPVGCSASPWQADSSYTATGLQAGASYEYQVRARDAFLNETAVSATTMATTTGNLAPTAVADIAGVEENGQVTVSVLSNDSDPEGDVLTVSSTTQGTNGSVAHNGSSVTYTPDAGFIGNDSFSYSIDDGFGGTASATVSVMVTAQNHLPVAEADSVTIASGDTVMIDVLVNDSDPDGDAITILSVGVANKGTVSWQPGQTNISYAHNPRRKGSDSFSYTISDGRGGSASTTVSITLGSSDSGDSSGSTGGSSKGGGKGKK